MELAMNCTELEQFSTLDWREVESRLSSSVRASLEKILESQEGDSLSYEECLQLAYAEGDDLLGLLLAADRLRRKLVGDVVTYVVNQNINFTNVCFIGCKFCAFSR
ncbi:MAG: 7,8-didemethyl-8-hydroxy-5-deazariboflavin synthase, partial [Acidobacteria bacterium]|nr:7,8-didemethyl-8-hydroxy-5-deazariboflavin synthase [Acidobacteriota bacterium]